LANSQWGSHDYHKRNGKKQQGSESSAREYNTIICPSSPEIEDENELRLLKMMGWSSKSEV